jgi:predicted RecA/RadA family phage recombinase
MATNYQQPGDVMEFTAPTGGVVAGTPKLIGNLLTIPMVSAAQTLPFEGATTGVWTMPKATGIVWTEGMILYWDNTAGNVTNVTTSNYRIGVAAAAAASGDATGKVRLNGVGVPTGA